MGLTTKKKVDASSQQSVVLYTVQWTECYFENIASFHKYLVYFTRVVLLRPVSEVTPKETSVSSERCFSQNSRIRACYLSGKDMHSWLRRPDNE